MEGGGVELKKREEEEDLCESYLSVLISDGWENAPG